MNNEVKDTLATKEIVADIYERMRTTSVLSEADKKRGTVDYIVIDNSQILFHLPVDVFARSHLGSEGLMSVAKENDLIIETYRDNGVIYERETNRFSTNIKGPFRFMVNQNINSTTRHNFQNSAGHRIYAVGQINKPNGNVVRTIETNGRAYHSMYFDRPCGYPVETSTGGIRTRGRQKNTEGMSRISMPLKNLLDYLKSSRPGRSGQVTSKILLHNVGIIFSRLGIEFVSIDDNSEVVDVIGASYRPHTVYDGFEWNEHKDARFLIMMPINYLHLLNLHRDSWRFEVMVTTMGQFGMNRGCFASAVGVSHVGEGVHDQIRYYDVGRYTFELADDEMVSDKPLKNMLPNKLPNEHTVKDRQLMFANIENLQSDTHGVAESKSVEKEGEDTPPNMYWGEANGFEGLGSLFG